MTQPISLPRALPTKQGISPSAIVDFIEAVNRSGQELNSLMIVRHGFVIAEGWWKPFERDLRHMLFSLSKSFTSTAAGFAVQEGLLSVDDKVIKFFPDQLPETICDNLAAMRVRDLLTMTTGHATDSFNALWNAQDGDWVRAILASPVEFEPGTHYLYNSGATYMVSAIVTKVTGQKVMDYLEPRLFEPLGIVDKLWEECPRGINTGGWGLNLDTESIAKFGQMYLNRGIFNGKRVLSEEWIDEATARQVSNGDDITNDGNQGYGYQFWRGRHNSYRGDGAFGQYCVVMPEQDMIVATTSALSDMGSVLSKVWEYLLPAAKSAPLPADPAAQDALDSTLQGLEIPLPEGSAQSGDESCAFGKTFRFPANDYGIESVRLDDVGDDVAVELVADGVAHRLAAGRRHWNTGDTSMTLRMEKPFTRFPSYRYGASSAWNGDTLSVRIAYIETPFSLLAALRFEANTLTLEITQKLAFHSDPRPPLTGVAD